MVVVAPSALTAGAAPTAPRAETSRPAPQLVQVQLVSRAAKLRVRRTTKVGLVLTSADGREHRKVKVCLTLPAAVRLVAPGRNGRRKGKRTVCWKARTVPRGGRLIVDARVRPLRAAKRATFRALLESPQIRPAAATWKVGVSR